MEFSSVDGVLDDEDHPPHRPWSVSSEQPTSGTAEVHDLSR